MAFKLIGGWPEENVIEVPVTAGVAIAEGDLLAINGNVLERATSSSTILTIFGVAKETITTADALIKVVPIIQGQVWEVDCASNTASNQLFESAVLTDHDTVNNTSSDVAGPTAVFMPFALKGVAGDKKLIGEFLRVQSTTA